MRSRSCGCIMVIRALCTAEGCSGRSRSSEEASREGGSLSRQPQPHETAGHNDGRCRTSGVMLGKGEQGLDLTYRAIPLDYARRRVDAELADGWVSQVSLYRVMLGGNITRRMKNRNRRVVSGGDEITSPVKPGSGGAPKSETGKPLDIGQSVKRAQCPSTQGAFQRNYLST